MAYDKLKEQQKRITPSQLPKKKKIREYRLPLVNFYAKNYWEMPIIKMETMEKFCSITPPEQAKFKVYTLNYKGPQQWEPVTEPPMLAHMSSADLDNMVVTPVSSIFPVHTQMVEHGVATTARSVKRRRTEKGQLMTALSTVAARQENPTKVTHKRYREKLNQLSSAASSHDVTV